MFKEAEESKVFLALGILSSVPKSFHRLFILPKISYCSSLLRNPSFFPELHWWVFLHSPTII
jgi:hypothetical protein